MVKKESRKGFTLIELLLVIGIIGVLSSVVIISINPEKQLCDVQNAARSVHVREIEKAMMQYMIGESSMPGGTAVPLGESNAKPICRTGVTDPTCVNLDDLVPEYVADIPVDETETSLIHTGFSVYVDSGSRQQVDAMNMEECTTTSSEVSSASSSASLASSAAPSTSSSSVATSSAVPPSTSSSSSVAVSSVLSSTTSSSSATFSSDIPLFSESSSFSSIIFGYGP